MKRLLSILMITVLLIVGCSPTPAPEDENNPPVEVESGEESPAVEEPTTGDENNPLERMLDNKDAWAVKYADQRVTVPYDVPDYEIDADQYAFDLNNLHNRDQFTDFTDGQRKLLEKNGFVVLKPNENYAQLKLHQIYEEADYRNLPVFISTDAVLNMYHIFYAESMKYMELSDYHPKLKTMTEQLLEKSLIAYDVVDEQAKEEIMIVTSYFAVAGQLLGIERELPDDVQTIVDTEIQRIEAAQAREQSLVFNKKIDYTQYTVRGHYTIAEALEDYFKAMMWYGQSGFQITEVNDGVEEIKDQNLKISLIITNLLMADGAQDLNNWIDIYDLTSLYSGTSDDLNVLDFAQLIEAVYGQAPTFDVFYDETMQEELYAAVKEMRNPQIIPKVLNEANEGKSFRLMGQRYTLDANIMQELVQPIQRPLPTAFDMLSAFGHERAEEILYEYYETNQNWPGYDDKLAEMKQLVDRLDDVFWKKDLYHGWLWSIDSAAKSFEGQATMPPFMQTKPWSHKNIATALGSFTELKYDNILYSKQVMAEMGGDIPIDEYHYVEPNVELYTKLQWLINYTKENIQLKVGDNTIALEPLERMDHMLDVLIDVSIKELNNETITEEELKTVGNIGGLVDYINFHYLVNLRDVSDGISDEDSSALVVDIATVTDGYYLEEAIGMPFEIYVITKVNGEIVLTKGSVYSYYEFVSDERLTTEQWYEMIGIETREHEQGFSEVQYMGEKINILEQMPWMNSYISPEPNNVKSHSPEVQWD